MRLSTRQPRSAWLLAAIVAAGLLAHGSSHAVLDLNATTDDHSVNVPTPWWTYTDVSASQIDAYLSQKGARLTDIEVYSVTNGEPRFTVRMVANSGAYAVPGWWWYHGLTAAEVTAQVDANDGRLIEIEPYDAGGGVIRFAPGATWWAPARRSSAPTSPKPATA
jgi:hypothetical protein